LSAFAIFTATWVALGIGIAVFYWKAGFEAKRRWHPWLLAGAGALFVGFVHPMFREPRILLFVVPVVILIQFLNYKFTRFCARCDATLMQNPP
jgi:hypothetical protein